MRPYNARQLSPAPTANNAGEVTARRAGIQTRELPQLLFKLADQPLKSIFGERIKGLFRHSLSLFQSPFQLFAVALFSHCVISVHI